MKEAIHKTGEDKLVYKSKSKKHLQTMIGIRVSKELKSNLNKIKRHLGLKNDSEVIRFIINERASSL